MEENFEYPEYKEELDRALSLFYEGKVNEAISEIENIMQEYGENLDLAIWKSYMLASSGRTDEAYNYLKTLEEDLGSHSEYWTQRGYTLLFAGNLMDAIGEFKKALEIDEKSYHASIGYAYSFYQLGVMGLVEKSELNECLRILQEREKEGWDTGELSTLMGLLYNLLEEKKEALNKLKEGFLKGTKEALSSIVQISSDLGDFKTIDELLAEGYDYLTLERTLWEHLRDPENALKLILRHLSTEYSDDSAVMGINISFETQNYDASEKILQKYLEKHPDDTLAKRLLGEAKAYLNKYEESLKILKEIEEQYQNDSTYKNVLGFVYYNTGKKDLALKCFKESTELDSKNASAWTNLGIFYYEEGEFEKAKECLEKAIEIAPDIISAKYYLALIYKELGDTEKYEKIIDELGIFGQILDAGNL